METISLSVAPSHLHLSLVAALHADQQRQSPAVGAQQWPPVWSGHSHMCSHFCNSWQKAQPLKELGETGPRKKKAVETSQSHRYFPCKFTHMYVYTQGFVTRRGPYNPYCSMPCFSQLTVNIFLS